MSNDEKVGTPLRTVLAERIKARGETLDEFAEYAERFAREHGEPGTLSLRNLQRLVSGRRDDGTPIRRVHRDTARLLEQILGLRLTELLAHPTTCDGDDESTMELRHRLNASSRIDDSIIQLLHDQLDALRRLDRQLGAIVAHDEVTTKIVQVTQLLRHSLLPDVRSRLAALLSELRALAGWQALDLGKAAEAWQHHERGKEIAAECHLTPFEVHTAAEQAFVLLDLARTADAVALLDAAHTRADRSASPLFRAWLSAARGEALAAAGEHAASMRSFDVAADLLPNDTANPDGPYVALNPVHLARWRGHALARLGESQAVDVLIRALDQLDPTFTRAETSLRVDLATALCSAGEYGEARRQVSHAEHLAQDIGSARQRHRLRVLDVRLR
jgi:tetratricopeptide (TPR) repeat protein